MELCNASPLSGETSTQGPLHLPLTDLYDGSYELLSAADLEISAEKVFVELSITNVESQEIEKATHLQKCRVEETKEWQIDSINVSCVCKKSPYY